MKDCVGGKIETSRFWRVFSKRARVSMGLDGGRERPGTLLMHGFQPFFNDDFDFALRKDRLDDLRKLGALGQLISGNKNLFHGRPPLPKE
jgi:hypothetical protein